MSGHPGSTQRSDTYAELVFDRDSETPTVIQVLKRRIALLKEYSTRGPEQSRQAASMIFSLENGRKVYEGRLLGLQDKNLMEKKRKEEEEFKAKVDANPEWKKEYGSAWERDAKSVEKEDHGSRNSSTARRDSQLAALAVNVVTYVAEIKKPDGERLAGFHEAQLESLKVRLFSPAPVYPEMDIARMTSALNSGSERNRTR